VFFVVFGSQLTIATAGNNTDRGVHARFYLRGTGGCGGPLARRGVAFEGPTGDGPSKRCSKQDVTAIGAKTGFSVTGIRHPCARGVPLQIVTFAVSA